MPGGPKLKDSIALDSDLQSIDLNVFPRLRTVEYVSPFRYPGGKSFLTGYLASVAETLPSNEERHYLEPYCGGAGAAFGLLSQGTVSHIHLNDGDIRVYSAWRAILKENERFIDALERHPISIETWYECRELLSQPCNDYSFDLGFATFFINRTSRAGIILGSGPIGGYDQSGKWKIDARFYKDTIRERVKWIGKNAEQIYISNENGVDFLKGKSKELQNSPTLYLIDPPYVKAGGRLYLDDMSEAKHRALASFLRRDLRKGWVLTYDDHPLVRELYQGCRIRKLHVNYSLRRIRKEAELLIEPM